MTIKSKIKKLLKNPYAISDKLRGINPNETIAFLQAITLLGKIEMLIDVGSHKGNFIKAGQRFFPDLKVEAFEPLKNVFEVKGKNINFHNIGLSDKTEQVDFYVPKIDSRSSILKIKKGSDKLYKGVEDYTKTKINVDRFDNLNIKIERPSMLKVFTQGSEFRVLKGFGDRLKEIDIIKIEYNFDKCYEHDVNLSEIVSFLEKWGFNGIFQEGLCYLGEESLNRLSHCYFLFFRIKKVEDDRNK